MKKYEKPELEVTRFATEVITTGVEQLPYGGDGSVDEDFG